MSDFINSVCESIFNLFIDEDGIILPMSVFFLSLVFPIVFFIKLFFSFFPAKKSESKDSELVPANKSELKDSELVVDIEEREYTKKLPKYNRH